MPRPEQTTEQEYIESAIRGPNYQREDEERAAAIGRASKKCTDACESCCPGIFKTQNILF